MISQNTQELPTLQAAEDFEQTDRTYDTILNIGSFKTEVDEKKVVRTACTNRLSTLTDLQRFGSEDWKDVRYSNALKGIIANPGFTDLKVNDELCYLDKGKDQTLSTE